VVVGVPAQGTEIPLAVNPMVHLDRRIMGVRYGEARPRRDIPLIVELYRQGRFKLDEMVTRTYPLVEWEQAMHDMHNGDLARGVLLF
jgi:S-(hydroxymethyl)glutathione dehydrogenase/alcohol dehydrogenase